MDDVDVIIAKGMDHASAFLNGVKLLGGFKEIIEKNDTVFIKITLNDIQGFPSHSNIVILRLIIKECKEAGAKQIYVGAIPINGIETCDVERILDLGEILKSSGAEFSFLDDQNLCSKINLEDHKLASEIDEKWLEELYSTSLYDTIYNTISNHNN